jgi:hypothetical protein
VSVALPRRSLRVPRCALALVFVTGAGLLLGLAPAARGNGSSWVWHSPSGVPRPVKASGLVLEKEEVLFRDGRAEASFWVRNRTSAAIETSMGFPLSQLRYDRPEWAQNLGHEGALEDARRRLGSFAVEVDGKRVPWRLATKVAGDYPTVIAWSGRYAPGRVTRFTVRYPILYSWFNDWDVAFMYITHTGAFWDGPVGEATFRFCDQKVMRFFLEVPHGRVWTQGGWSVVEYRWDVHPPGFVIDRKARCLVWRRRAWKPERKDDLYVALGSKPFDASDGTEFLPDEKKLLDIWCAHYAPDLHAGLGWPFLHPAKVQLAAELRLDRRLLDEKLLARVEETAWARLVYANDMGPKLANTPPHIRLLVKQKLLEYLRTYPLGIRGKARLEPGTITFQQDDAKVEHKLPECFSKVRSSRRGPLTTVESRNIAFLRTEEARVAAQLKAELAKLTLLDPIPDPRGIVDRE